VPPWGGREHATVLVPPQAEGKLADFKARFDHYGKNRPHARPASEGLRWLAEQASADGIAPVVIYNHPSRKAQASTDHASTLTEWRNINDLVIGFEGAPGHQGANPPGAFKGPVQLLDRWDPAAAKVGDAWDTLLGQGLDLWAALAASDFHNAEDYWPGQFSETWLYAPERSAAGVLRALRAGSFFAAHGHIVREVELRATAAGLPRPAQAGEVVAVPPGAEVTVEVRAVVPERDWAEQPNRLDEVELIAIHGGQARVVARAAPTPGKPALVHRMAIPDSGLVLRARGRRVLPDGPDLMFHTNPLRLQVAGSS
jgi:hypothetical protein